MLSVARHDDKLKCIEHAGAKPRFPTCKLTQLNVFGRLTRRKNTMNTELLGLIDGAHAVMAKAESRFGNLSTEQLNWKPSASEWSVAQCLEHLIVGNSGFFPIVERINRGEYHPSLRERLPLLPRFFGSMVLRAVQPEAQRKFKAGPRFDPSRSEVPRDIIARFGAHQQQLIDHMKLAKDVDLKKTIITSPVASFATYSMLDAFKIVIAHERRHLAQAKRVTEREGFPLNSAVGKKAVG
jgi:DinB superfamily